MKILKLTFMNLNSLYGTWEIDFNDPDYQSNGIFALTGPTGSGKSTILDAICLALYGETPRLGRITQKENEIMSRNTGECFSEVVFQTQTGSYMCHWSQHRARKRPDGKLADAKHEISESVNGTVLETKKREVLSKVESITGMDFSRFTRSILLAQGGFDSFLKADTDEKSKILEQITGVEIYTEISKMVFERQKEEKQRLTVLKAGLEDLVLLTAEEIDERLNIISQKSEEEVSLKNAYTAVVDSINWLGGIARLKEELAQLEGEQKRSSEELGSFLPKRERLEAAQRAAEVDGLYGELEQLRRQHTVEKQQLESFESSLPEKKEERSKAKELLISSKERLVSDREGLQELQKVISDVRLLDQKIMNASETVAKTEERRTGITLELAEKEHSKETNLEAISSISSDREEIRSYLTTHSDDELLVAEYSAINANLQTIADLGTSITDLKEKIQMVEESIADQKKSIRSQEASVKEQELQESRISQRISEERAAIEKLLEGRLLREYRDEYKRALKEKALIGKIINLEEERDRLAEGAPCPLCGAMEHPYAEAETFTFDEVDKRITFLEGKIETIERIGEGIQNLESEQSQAEIAHRAAHDLLKEMLTNLNQSESKLEELREKKEESENQNQGRCGELFSMLEPLGVEVVDAKHAVELSSRLKAKLDRWKKSSEEDGNLKVRCEQLLGDNKLLDDNLKSLESRLTESDQELEQTVPLLSALKKERQELFGDTEPDRAEVEAEERVKHSEDKVNQSETVFQERNQETIEISSKIEQLKESISARSTRLEESEIDFRKALSLREIKSEAGFLAIRLDLDTRRDLIEQADTLDKRHQEILTKIKDRNRRLTEESEKALTEESPEELDLKKRDLDTSLQELREEMSSIQFSLKQDAANHERVKDKQSKIEGQEKIFTRWNTLNSYIGSADGKKFRNYAQGLTFELMVSHANRQLQKMTERYLLMRNEQAPLELNVIDNYQAGEIRSIKNLSGGESFIVSLALALGLSSMSSKRVKVDSLFLDEGFGTLDEEVLDTALEMLSGLHEDNKLIGVISHVPALKERIGVQIRITAHTGGKSSISGPGCRQLNE